MERWLFCCTSIWRYGSMGSNSAEIISVTFILVLFSACHSVWEKETHWCAVLHWSWRNHHRSGQTSAHAWQGWSPCWAGSEPLSANLCLCFFLSFAHSEFGHLTRLSVSWGTNWSLPSRASVKKWRLWPKETWNLTLLSVILGSRERHSAAQFSYSPLAAVSSVSLRQLVSTLFPLIHPCPSINFFLRSLRLHSCV